MIRQDTAELDWCKEGPPHRLLVKAANTVGRALPDGSDAPVAWVDDTHLLYLQDGDLRLANVAHGSAALVAPGVLDFAYAADARRVFLLVRGAHGHTTLAARDL